MYLNPFVGIVDDNINTHCAVRVPQPSPIPLAITSRRSTKSVHLIASIVSRQREVGVLCRLSSVVGSNANSGEDGNLIVPKVEKTN